MAALQDGYQSLISFAADTTVLFYEKELTPPGVDGGGAIDQTTMLNSTWRTKAPKSLADLTTVNVTVTYDPACYPEAIALVNVNNLITVTFPDGDTLAFWGWLNKFTPGKLAEGEKPTAEIEVIPSNLNASGVETAPAHTPAV